MTTDHHTPTPSEASWEDAFRRYEADGLIRGWQRCDSGPGWSIELNQRGYVPLRTEGEAGAFVCAIESARHAATPAPAPAPVTYSLQQIRCGTGWRRGIRFAIVEEGEADER